MERLIRITRTRREKGYTLLEYCAGAAIIAGIVWGAMNLLGNNLSGFLTGLGNWVNDRTSNLQ